MSGSYIWIPDEKQVWAVGLVQEAKKGKSVKVQTKDGKEKKVEGPLTKYDTVSQDDLSRECENLVELDSFTEGLILHHIKERFARGTIYTFVGSILVAVNPFRRLDVYGEDTMMQVWNQTRDGRGGGASPHVFAIAAQALYDLRETNRNQAVLISGESGAGKTETTKKILQFISTMAAAVDTGVIPPKNTAEGSMSIEDQILGTNPILESFGNAKTIKNNNSSRFGKYMEIEFNDNNRIIGSAIRTYLLEKNRVMAQGPNERNYHIFYMLLAGASKDMKQEFGLDGKKDPEQWNILSMSGCTKVSGRNEKAEYVELVNAFEQLHFDSDAIKTIFQLLGAVLHIGNVTFKSLGEGSEVEDKSVVAQVATLIGIADPAVLEECMCNKELIINRERTLVKLSPDQAKAQRNALATFLYSAVFDSLVVKINETLGKAGEENDGDTSSKRDIGILDIFGFEVFAVNSFEQLCINYCNERLQTFFNEVIFEKEIQIYRDEHIDLADITFQDNLGCVRIIDGAKGHGIFSLLDEECIVPQGSDTKLLHKMNSGFAEKKSANFSTYYATGSRKNPDDFIVKHFAGDVSYNITDFMEKNKDTMNEAMVHVVENSSLPLVHEAAAPDDEHHSDDHSTHSGRSGGKKSKITISKKFKNNLDELMTTLHSKQPAFCRCLKPNDSAKADKFECPLLLSQMKYSGLFEAIKIRKSGFAVRIACRAFYLKYRALVPLSKCEEYGIKQEPLPREGKDGGNTQAVAEAVRAQCKALLKALEGCFGGDKGKSTVSADVVKESIEWFVNKKGEAKKWVIGDTKVFLRTTHALAIFDRERSERIVPPAVSKIQRCMRHFLSVGREQRLANLAEKEKQTEERNLAREQRGFTIAAQESYDENETYRDSLDKVARAAQHRARERAEELRRLAIKKNKCSIKLQALVRGKLGRVKGRTYMCETRFEKALIVRDETALYIALKKAQAMGVRSKAISAYKKSASAVILDVLSEAHVVEQLVEAIKSDSDYLLTDAINNAEASHMGFLPQVATAKHLLSSHKRLKVGLRWLHHQLSAADTVPLLLQSVDYIRRLIKEAATKGLHHEPVCEEALFRISKIKRLVSVRDQMRVACEMVSKKAMESAMETRSKFVKIFGEEVFDEEVVAIKNMLRMISCIPSIASYAHHGEDSDEDKSSSESELSSDEEDEEEEEEEEEQDEEEGSGGEAEGKADDEADADNTTATANKPKGKSKKSKTASASAANDDPQAQLAKAAKSRRKAARVRLLEERAAVKAAEAAAPTADVMLPTWLRELFLLQKKVASRSTAQEELDYHLVTKKINRLCPSASTLREYQRVFKWTIAFCTWLPDHPRHDSEIHPFGNDIGSGSGAGAGAGNNGSGNGSSQETDMFAPPSDGAATYHEADTEEAQIKLQSMTLKSRVAARNKGSDIPHSTARAAAGKASNPIDPATGKDKYGRTASKLLSSTKNLGHRGTGSGHAFGPPTHKQNKSRVDLRDGINSNGGSSSSSSTATSRASRRPISALVQDYSAGGLKPHYMGSKSTVSHGRTASEKLREAALKKGRAHGTRSGAGADQIIEDAIEALGDREKNARSRHGSAWT